MELEDLKTIRLLLKQHSYYTERILKYLPDMHPVRSAVLAAYTKIEKAIALVERDIRTAEGGAP